MNIDNSKVRCVAVALVVQLHAVVPLLASENVVVVPAALFVDGTPIEIPGIELDPVTGEHYAMLPGDIRATFDLAHPNVVSLSNPDWAEGIVYEIQIALDNDSQTASFTGTFVSEAGENVGLHTGTIEIPGDTGVATVSLTDYAGGASSTVIYDPDADASVATVQSTTPLEVITSEWEPSDGKLASATTSNSTPSAAAVATVLGLGVVGALVIILVAFIATFNSPYNCTSWWSRFWNDC